MDIKEKFIKDFPIIKGNKKEPYIITFDAYTGQGKSYISKIISKYDNSIIVNNDDLRHWLNDYSKTNDLLYDLQKYRINELLKNNNSIILDSCSCVNWDYKKEYLDKSGYKYYIIRLECNDNTVKERINKRLTEDNNTSHGTYEDYIWMKENVSHIDNVDYIIDTSKDIEEQVLDFLNKYNLNNI